MTETHCPQCNVKTNYVSKDEEFVCPKCTSKIYACEGCNKQFAIGKCSLCGYLLCADCAKDNDVVNCDDEYSAIAWHQLEELNWEEGYLTKFTKPLVAEFVSTMERS